MCLLCCTFLDVAVHLVSVDVLCTFGVVGVVGAFFVRISSANRIGRNRSDGMEVPR